MAAPRLGIVGAGQLARMTHQAAIGLGLSVRLLAADASDSAAVVAGDVVVGSARDERGVTAFGAGCDVVTIEHELIDAPALAKAERNGLVAVRPSSEVVAVAQDKARQRDLMGRLGLASPVNAVVADAGSVRSFGLDHGWPVVLKSARGGYDGRGVAVVDDEIEAAAAHSQLARGGGTVLAESFVDIGSEAAVMVARGMAGESSIWAVTRTVQVGGICRELIVPSGLSDEVEGEAGRIARALADELNLVGLLAVELFVVGDGELVVNEVAARPHNSGHWTIEGARTSQFENLVRAVLGWPLGATVTTAPAVVTVNLLGPADGSDPAGRLASALGADSEAKVHLYGKSSRPGRKLGHVTVVADDVEAARSRARAVAERLTGDPIPHAG